MGLRVTLDDTILANTPKGWDKAKIDSKRSTTLKGLFLSYSSTLEFWGDGFDYIDDVMNDDYCNIIKVTIETNDCMPSGEWNVEFNGIIQIPQISEYNVKERIISTKIFDDTFDAKINNNKSLKAFVDVGVSKNGVSINPAPVIPIRMFNPAAGFSSYDVTPANGFRVFDCFKFILDYMTDGEVGFKSDLLSGELYDWVLFNGKELRLANGGGDQLEVSFKELITEINKKANISFAIEPDDTGYSGDFRLRLEKTEYFEQDDALLILDNVDNIRMSFNKQELYSNVEIGSKAFDDDIVLSYPPINFKAFKEENYTLLGQCNIDKTLDLVSKYIIDSNVIEDVVVNSVEKYDKKTFLIVTDGVLAEKYKEYGVPLSEGTTTSTVVMKLVDSGATFVSDGVTAGDMVANMSTGLDSAVIVVDSETTLTLGNNIMTSGDDYQVRPRPFSYNDPLTNIKVIERFNGGLPSSVIKHLSTSSIANFHASTTSDLSGSQNPVPFDDDSTPPNFDDGGFYDATTNFDYTIPNNGIYGFRNTLPLRLNGMHEDINKVVNGTFDTDTDWNYSSGVISDNEFRVINNSTIGVNMFLKQNSVFEIGFKYIVNFYCEVKFGEIRIFDNIITQDGNYQFILDNSVNPISQLTFDFVSYSNAFVAKIKNVSAFKTPKVQIDNKILKSTNSGTTITEYTISEDIIFDEFVYQQDFDFTNERTFSTFKGEKITVEYVVTFLSGKNTSSTIKSGATYETVLVDDGGGDILPVESSSFPIYKYKFKKALTFEQFNSLKDNPEKAIHFSESNDNHIFGWRNSVKYDRETGVTDFDVRSKTKIKPRCQQG